MEEEKQDPTSEWRLKVGDLYFEQHGNLFHCFPRNLHLKQMSEPGCWRAYAVMEAENVIRGPSMTAPDLAIAALRIKLSNWQKQIELALIGWGGEGQDKWCPTCEGSGVVSPEEP